MKILQFHFTKNENGSGFKTITTINNTNFAEYYYGQGHPEESIAWSASILISLLGYIVAPTYGVKANPIIAGMTPLDDYSMQVVVAQCFNTAQQNEGLVCKIDHWNAARVTLTFFEADAEGLSVPDNRKLLVTHTSASLVERIRTMAPTPNNPFSSEPTLKPPDAKKAGKPVCRNCGSGFTAKEVPLSTGETVVLCRDCTQLTTCQICEFAEPSMYVKRTIAIVEETGKNEKSFVCRKCAGTLQQCRGCGHHYDHKKEEACPCKLKLDFKTMVQAFNADVCKVYQPDMFSNELFGVEIEAGTLNTNRRHFSEIAAVTNELIKNNAILKYDSSIDFINKAEQIDNDFKGFEVVTRPMVYKNTLRFLREFCKNVHPMLRSWEVGTCGIHIHVSKACLRPMEIGKILKFINNKCNRKFIRMIAKREDKKFAKFLTKKITDYQNNTPGPNGIPHEHYEAINTSKPWTIEFRIFRGTLNIRTIMSYLQFVKSVIEFVRVTNCDDETLTYENYLDFLFSTERSQFRELKERIRNESMKEIADRGEI